MRRALIALALFAACDRVPKPAPVDPVSAIEAQELANAFAAAMSPCDPAKVDALVDFETVLRRAMAKADVPSDAKRAFIEGAREGPRLGAMLCPNLGAGAIFDLLRIRDVGGQPRPLFRLVSADGINYHELELGKSRNDHRVRVVDIGFYISGEQLSETYAAQVRRVVDANGEGARIGIMNDVMAARQRGDRAEVRRLIATMPDWQRKSKPIRIIELSAAADDAALARMIEEYERAFPHDPSLNLVSIDGYFLRKDVPSALAAVDRLDRQLGGDPSLNVLRANAHMLEPTPEHLAEAEQAARSATQALPHHPMAWWTLATVRLHRRDHAGTIAALETLRTQFDVDFSRENLQQQPLYVDLLKSPEFEAWWAKQSE